MIRARARVTLTSITALLDDLVRELDVQGVHPRGYLLTDASQVRQHTGTIVLLQFPQDVLHLKTTHYNVCIIIVARKVQRPVKGPLQLLEPCN